MLLNTHTWLLKEYAGARLRRDNLDILIYNVIPDILPIHRDITPEMTHRLERLVPVPPGHRKARFKLSNELRRQAINGPTPVSSSRNIPMGMFTRLKKGVPTLIFSPVTASEITGNNVPHSTAKQLASRIRLLNMKADSRERTLSRRASLFR